METSRQSSDARIALAPIIVVSMAALAGLLLAPWLGELLSPAPLEFWPELTRRWGDFVVIDPEPEELVRFAVAALAPIAIAVIILFDSHRNARRDGLRLEAAAALMGTPLILLGVVGFVTRSEPRAYGLATNYFSGIDLAIAIVVAAGLLGAALAPVPRAWIRRKLRRDGTAASHRWSTFAVGSVVVLLTVLWTLPSIYTDANLPDAPELSRGHVPFTFADFAAFGNGATPLGDFAAQYSNLLPWVLHPVLDLASYGPGSFTVVMGVLTVLGMVALWRAVVLAVGHEVVGALLYLPVLAVSLRPTFVVADERMTNASLFQIMPERYVIVLVVLWLCVRRSRGLRPRVPFVIFLLAGLALINNPEFGGPCLLAALLALIVAEPEPPARSAPRLMLHLVGGVLAAVAIVTVITVLRSGEPPDPAMLTYFSRLFAAQGFGLEPMPTLGFHLVLYVTFVATLGAGAVRRAAGTHDRPLNTLLVFAGTLGLGAGAYYAGRSNAITLVALFPVWGLCMAALAWLVFRWLLSVRHWRALLAPRGAVAVCALVGFGLVATDLPDIPSPAVQVRRLGDESDRTATEVLRAAERFVADRSAPGEAVLILRQHGHLVAQGAGVRNVSYIGHPFHVIAPEQLDVLLSDLEQAGGTAVFVGKGNLIHEGMREELVARGWHLVADDPSAGMEEWRK